MFLVFRIIKQVVKSYITDQSTYQFEILIYPYTGSQVVHKIFRLRPSICDTKAILSLYFRTLNNFSTIKWSVLWAWQQDDRENFRIRRITFPEFEGNLHSLTIL